MLFFYLFIFNKKKKKKMKILILILIFNLNFFLFSFLIINFYLFFRKKVLFYFDNTFDFKEADYLNLTIKTDFNFLAFENLYNYFSTKTLLFFNEFDKNSKIEILQKTAFEIKLKFDFEELFDLKFNKINFNFIFENFNLNLIFNFKIKFFLIFFFFLLNFLIF